VRASQSDLLPKSPSRLIQQLRLINTSPTPLDTYDPSPADMHQHRVELSLLLSGSMQFVLHD